jgi:NAD(P)H-quinone oxidoreductase subunit 4
MLSLLIWLPLLGILVIALVPSEQGNQIRKLTLGLVGVTLLWSCWLAFRFDVGLGVGQFREAFPWLNALGLSYRLSLDGLSLPLVILNALLTWVAVYSSDRNLPRAKLYYSLILLINAGVAGAFLAENNLLFFLFYELELIPLYLLIGIWGGANRGYAATKFLIYTAISGILLVGGFLGLAWLSGSTSFNYVLGQGNGLSLLPQLLLMGALLVGFAIKIPMVPFHTWLPDAHVEASTPVSVLLAGVLLKLGTYGILRYCLGLFPEAWEIAAPWLATWSAISVLYGSLNAIAQTDMKKMVAYSSIGHMGFVLLACAASTPLSLLGTVFQMVSHGLISGVMFLLVGVVYKKTGTRNLEVLRGLLNPECGLPLIGSFLIIGVMASAGLPGMIGFVSEFLVFRGSFAAFPVQTLLCMVGTGLTAVYFLLLVNRAFFGRLAIEPNQVPGQVDIVLPPVGWDERIPAIALTVLIIWGGLQPSFLANWSETTITAVLSPQAVVAQGSMVAERPSLANGLKS